MECLKWGIQVAGLHGMSLPGTPIHGIKHNNSVNITTVECAEKEHKKYRQTSNISTPNPKT